MNESNISDFYREMGISDRYTILDSKYWKNWKAGLKKIDETAEYNQMKVLKALQENKVSEACLLGTTGYGYNDLGKRNAGGGLCRSFSYTGRSCTPADNLRHPCRLRLLL